MRRRLGQHFLTRQPVLERIATAVCPERCGTVIEIGPGKGALTAHLIERAERVIAVEVDPVLSQYLRAKFRDRSQLEIVEGDVLKTDLARWGPAIIAGNLPYYITSPILDRVLSLGALLQYAVFLVQKEVAQRLIGSPGSRDYGYLSVQTQLLSRPELLFMVEAPAFHPPPQVESAVVRLTPHAKPQLANPREFLRFAALCFRQKRKTLRNNLIGRYGSEVIDNLCAGKQRAEQLSIPELAAIYKKLCGERLLDE